MNDDPDLEMDGDTNAGGNGVKSSKKRDTALRANRPCMRRLLEYRERLSRGRPFTCREIAETLEVSERTVLRDLDFARSSLNWKIAFDGRRGGFISVDSDLPLPCLALSQGELIALLVGEQALRQYAGTPYAEALRGAFDALVAALDTPVSIDIPADRLPRFTGPPLRPVTVEQFGRLSVACRDRVRLEIEYRSMERDEVTTRRIDPYQLFAYGGDWYLAAFDHRRGRFQTFALGDRMRSIRPLEEGFRRDPSFDLDRYLEDGFGLFRGGEVADVALRFAPAAARYVREKVWDDTEKREDLPGGGLILRMRVPVSVGLLRFILQYGAEVEVLEPESLRKQVIDVLKTAYDRYERRD